MLVPIETASLYLRKLDQEGFTYGNAKAHELIRDRADLSYRGTTMRLEYSDFWPTQEMLEKILAEGCTVLSIEELQARSADAYNRGYDAGRSDEVNKPVAIASDPVKENTRLLLKVIKLEMDVSNWKKSYDKRSDQLFRAERQRDTCYGRAIELQHKIYELRERLHDGKDVEASDHQEATTGAQTDGASNPS